MNVESNLFQVADLLDTEILRATKQLREIGEMAQGCAMYGLELNADALGSLISDVAHRAFKASEEARRLIDEARADVKQAA